MANGTQLTKTEALSKLESVIKSNKSLRDKVAKNLEGTVETAATIGGGALGGYLKSEYPDKEIFGVNMGLAAGTVMTVVGIMGLAGKQSSMVGAMGEGILAYEVGDRVAKREVSSGAVGAKSDKVSAEDLLRAVQEVANRAAAA